MDWSAFWIHCRRGEERRIRIEVCSSAQRTLSAGHAFTKRQSCVHRTTSPWRALEPGSRPGRSIGDRACGVEVGSWQSGHDVDLRVMIDRYEEVGCVVGGGRYCLKAGGGWV